MEGDGDGARRGEGLGEKGAAGRGGWRHGGVGEGVGRAEEGEAAIRGGGREGGERGGERGGGEGG